MKFGVRRVRVNPRDAQTLHGEGQNCFFILLFGAFFGGLAFLFFLWSPAASWTRFLTILSHFLLILQHLLCENHVFPLQAPPRAPPKRTLKKRQARGGALQKLFVLLFWPRFVQAYFSRGRPRKKNCEGSRTPS